MTDGVPPPPPNLKPPQATATKKRKNLTIKFSEFEAWNELKGEMSWSAVMEFVRKEYLRLRQLKPVIMHGGNGKGIQRLSTHKNTPTIRGQIQPKVANNMRQVMSELRNFTQDNLTKVPEEELAAIKLARFNRVKNRLVIS